MEISKLKWMQWGIGIKVIKIPTGTSGRLRRHHGGTILVSDGLKGTNNHSHNTQVQRRTSRHGPAGIRKDHSIILTGQGSSKRGWTTGISVTKGISITGTTGTRATKGILMCHRIRGTIQETIKISNRVTQVQQPSTTIIKEVREIFARTRWLEPIKIKDLIPVQFKVSDHSGILMTWCMIW